MTIELDETNLQALHIVNLSAMILAVRRGAELDTPNVTVEMMEQWLESDRIPDNADVAVRIGVLDPPPGRQHPGDPRIAPRSQWGAARPTHWWLDEIVLTLDSAGGDYRDHTSIYTNTLDELLLVCNIGWMDLDLISWVTVEQASLSELAMVTGLFDEPPKDTAEVVAQITPDQRRSIELSLSAHAPTPADLFRVDLTNLQRSVLALQAKRGTKRRLFGSEHVDTERHDRLKQAILSRIDSLESTEP